MEVDANSVCSEDTPKHTTSEAVGDATGGTWQSRPVSDIFIQCNQSFRKTDRQRYERMITKEIKQEASSPPETVQVAAQIQRAFHSTAVICQGFLSGWAAANITYFFADEIEGHYRSYCANGSVFQTVFYILFIVGAVSALDRLECQKSAWATIRKVLSLQAGSLALFLSLIGALLSLFFDVQNHYGNDLLMDQMVHENQTSSGRVICQWIGVSRALVAMFTWLLLAFSPDENPLLHQIQLLYQLVTSNANIVGEILLRGKVNANKKSMNHIDSERKGEELRNPRLGSQQKFTEKSPFSEVHDMTASLEVHDMT
ncbi:hypothetical protein AB6A40_000287 [Gnathostoma spinigerum]|uniref:Transmembrane protein n=1 Tax=Gnathostoma spinigerum TaxID=75299 RepID=A0ABD6E1W9_9BILA